MLSPKRLSCLQRCLPPSPVRLRRWHRWLANSANALRKKMFRNLVFCCIKMSSACGRQRKQYLYRRIVRSNYRKPKKTRALSRNRRVSKRVCLTCMFQNPVIQHDDSSIGVAFSLIFYSLSWVLKFMFERVCFVFHYKIQCFQTYIHNEEASWFLLFGVFQWMLNVYVGACMFHFHNKT